MRRRRRGSNMPILVVIVVLLLLVGGAWYVANRNKPSAAGQPGAGAPVSAVGKPKAIAQTYNGCPASGDGGDPALNTLKNRIDEAPWQPSTVTGLLALTWPPDVERQPRARWSGVATEEIARNEGAPVQVVGYLLDAKSSGPESCNCHSVKDADFHIWLADNPGKTRAESLVVEVSPRVRTYHPAWTLANLRNIINRKQPVRISGWLMFDPEHPDQIGKTRGTIWEIHPIMQIETQSGGNWKPLDTGSTGVTSVPALAAATADVASQITPETIATLLPVGAGGARNKPVQITNVNYNGTKGRTEPDEYVEIANKGSEPVDMSGWILLSLSHDDEFQWDTYTLQPGASIRVYTDEVHNDTGGFSFGSTNPVWTNTGDTAELRDEDGSLVSRFAYGNKK
ncbi:MAG: lamin tail domain-containing protein [Chloroflexia bacterium]